MNTFAQEAAKESGKALIGGAIAGTVFGAIGWWIYESQASPLCDQPLGGSGNPLVDCTVSVPLLGEASSAAEAATKWGLPIAILVFVVAIVLLAAGQSSSS